MEDDDESPSAGEIVSCNLSGFYENVQDVIFGSNRSRPAGRSIFPTAGCDQFMQIVARHGANQFRAEKMKRRRD